MQSSHTIPVTPFPENLSFEEWEALDRIPHSSAPGLNYASAAVSYFRDDVFRSKLPYRTKVVCLFLADYADPRTDEVSIPRAEIAEALDMSQQAIKESLAGAVEHGLLVRVLAGRPGTTAIYRINPRPSWTATP